MPFSKVCTDGELGKQVLPIDKRSQNILIIQTGIFQSKDTKEQ